MAEIRKHWEKITRETTSVAYAATVNLTNPGTYVDNEIVIIGTLTGNITIDPKTTGETGVVGGAPRTGQRLFIRLTADGTARSVTLTGASGPAVANVTASKTCMLELLFDGTGWWNIGAFLTP
jgi:hypothetical protein